MALGYENTGIGPRLIANAGNAMTESIRQFGEKLQKDIVAHNTDKQVAGFLTEAQSLNLDSPTFQGDLVGVLAKYPMAAGDQRALMGAKLLATGWEQKQAQKEAVQRFEERKTLAGMRNTGGGLYGDGPTGGFNPDLPALPATGESAAFDAGGQVLGAMSPLGVPFNPQTEVPTTDEPNPLFNRDLDQTFRKIGVDKRTGTRLMAQDAAAKAREGRKGDKPIFRNIQGVGVGLWNPETRSLDIVAEGKPTQRWLNMGSHWENAETGEQKPIELSPAQRSAEEGRQAANADRDAARMDRTAARDATQRAAVVKTQLEDRKRDLNSVEKEITRLKKISTPSAQEQKDLAELQQSHGTLMKKVSDLETELGAVGTVKKLDSEAAMELLKEAGGDRDKARELARQRGYSL